jgi:hypothetical protein
MKSVRALLHHVLVFVCCSILTISADYISGLSNADELRSLRDIHWILYIIDVILDIQSDH